MFGNGDDYDEDDGDYATVRRSRRGLGLDGFRSNYKHKQEIVLT